MAEKNLRKRKIDRMNRRKRERREQRVQQQAESHGNRGRHAYLMHGQPPAALMQADSDSNAGAQMELELA